MSAPRTWLTKGALVEVAAPLNDAGLVGSYFRAVVLQRFVRKGQAGGDCLTFSCAYSQHSQQATAHQLFSTSERRCCVVLCCCLVQVGGAVARGGVVYCLLPYAMPVSTLRLDNNSHVW